MLSPCTFSYCRANNCHPRALAGPRSFCKQQRRLRQQSKHVTCARAKRSKDGVEFHANRCSLPACGRRGGVLTAGGPCAKCACGQGRGGAAPRPLHAARPKGRHQRHTQSGNQSSQARQRAGEGRRGTEAATRGAAPRPPPRRLP